MKKSHIMILYAHYNSLIILCDNHGWDKSHIMIPDVIQVSRLKNASSDLIVYVSWNGTINDITFESQSDLMQLPIKLLKIQTLKSTLNNLIYIKNCMTSTCQLQKWQSNKKKLNNMFTFLQIIKLGKPNKKLNTIILLKDFLKSK